MDLLAFAERFGFPSLCLILLAVQYIRQERHYRAELKGRDKRAAELQSEIDRQRDMRAQEREQAAALGTAREARFERLCEKVVELGEQQALTIEARYGEED